MNWFADTLARWFSSGLSFLGDMFSGLFSLLAKPLSFLLQLIEGIFYFIYKLFEVLVLIVQLFVALFQLVGSLIYGLLLNFKSMLSLQFNHTVSYPSSMSTGIKVVVEQILEPIGFMTVVPLLFIAVLWVWFAMRMLKLISGEVHADA
ncbi:hypothetical protein [Paenibacillus sp. NAIST15-1]|uniref:hypothetical protein n=1 Tax=Paenibacillus sp. NAIST15-1 TaxID=1605994 RepID=UPI0008686062|nr:hypothetical protein [Paenibacillus sp. NAIST15-1]GAV16104.1 hypothetical protein PBN151_6089 [Paenibacillus sp. NAIST15-1]